MGGRFDQGPVMHTVMVSYAMKARPPYETRIEIKGLVLVMVEVR